MRSTEASGNCAMSATQSPTRICSPAKAARSPIDALRRPRVAALCGRRDSASRINRLGGFSRLESESELDRREGAAVMGRRAEGAERRLMLGRAVADIGRPAIAAIAFGQTMHDAVARHLGDDRGG